ncbi:hypothetical protein NPS01_23210 [Nocardioides psychrotolerans]|uniref:Uncharacterized membrane protein n=1 Tax=Nocardioides psychrotolerans TaxID=1005945 RepID=A0A1I3HZZ1_9ACTN|nr:hypothetical protein [Nocardioides psychrotolerans]GEP38658.1 hypothetical protein NPS01_23210 [Nocardioides psychrotolerans]SFI41338.1 Uncharacterized membrane protein [Nocardioides psychrotolerans]
MSNYGPPGGIPPEQPPLGGDGTPPPPPPPPAGGYGAAPPPPPGGYGAPPPGGYGAPPQGASGWDVGSAISYGWAKFQANVGQIIIAGLVVFGGIVIFQIIGAVIRNVLVQDPECYTDSNGFFQCDVGSGFVISLVATAISSLLFFVVYQIIGAGIIRGALSITEGRPFTMSEVFKTDRIGPVIITSVISSVIIFVGFLLCILPGIVAAFFLQYALYFLLDKDMEPMDAIKASVTFVKDNLGSALVWSIVSYVIILVGAILCGVGLIVAIPVSLIGTAYTYKHLTGQPVAP